MSPPEAWTIGRLLKWTTDFLKEHGADSPRLDAEVLLAAACGCQRIDLYARFDEVARDEPRAAFRELVRRRAEGAPVAYLVGKREFFSLPFRVGPDVLIPRPETETLVMAALERLKQRPAGAAPPLVADIGTGSGIVAVCLAKFGKARLIAVDISPAALDVARSNAATLGVADAIEFFGSDLFANVPSGRRFDVVASNPPYVSDAEIAALPRDVKDHEPHLALAAGPTGTAVIERLIPAAAERLVPGGWLAMEISPMIAERVVQLIAADGRFEPAGVRKDAAGRQRVVEARRRAD